MAGSAHVLVIGTYSPVTDRLWAAGATTSLLCDRRTLARHRGLHEHASLTVTDDADDHHLATLAIAVHHRNPLTHVVSTDDASTTAAALVRDTLHLPGGDPLPVVRTVHDKHLYRDALAGTTTPVPHARVTTTDDILTFGHTHGWPVVVKPARGSGSAGVTLDVTPTTAAHALHHARHADPRHPEVLVEHQVPGHLLTIDTLTHHGRHHVTAVGFELTATLGPAVTVAGIPAPLPASAQDAVVGAVSAALTRLGVTTGPAHTEVLLGADDRVCLVETQLRPGGDVPELTAAATGVDVYGAWASILLEQDPLPALRPRPDPVSCVVVWGAPDADVAYRELRGVPPAGGRSNVAGVRVLAAPPYSARPVRTRDDASLGILCTGPTPHHALRRAERSLARTRMRVALRTPGTPGSVVGPRRPRPEER